MKIEGKWIGEYTYGEEYPESFKGKSIRFEMKLTANGSEFSGNFSDDETRNIFQDKGIVDGFIEGNFISFDKHYPKTVNTTEEGTLDIIAESIPPTIKYEGTLREDYFEGNWEIHQYYLSDDGPFSMILGTGTWKMTKATI